MNKIQAIRGMNDILPEQIPHWHFLEDTLKKLFTQYGYHEIRFPILESSQLFKRSIGDVTDIVEKEMYSFEDRNGDELCLRPEGTAGCVRAALQHGLLHNQTQKFWYLGPMYRHERPQKGRYRQFYQFGAEAFGFPGPDIDIELILVMKKLWEQLGLLNHCELQINSLGTIDARNNYKKILINYFENNKTQLDADSNRRLYTNPLRILDSKNPELIDLINQAPKLMDYLDQESQEHFEKFKLGLEKLNINYKINPNLVRGLDYYGKTVFEWVTTELGAQGTLCAGGRYDGLVEQIGGHATPGIGFAMGLERILLLLEEINSEPGIQKPFIYSIAMGEQAENHIAVILESLRAQFPDKTIIQHMGGGSFKSQFKKADKSGAQIGLILGDDEVENKTIGIKYLREDKPQDTVSWDELEVLLANVASQG